MGLVYILKAIQRLVEFTRKKGIQCFIVFNVEVLSEIQCEFSLIMLKEFTAEAVFT